MYWTYFRWAQSKNKVTYKGVFETSSKEREWFLQSNDKQCMYLGGTLDMRFHFATSVLLVYITTLVEKCYGVSLPAKAPREWVPCDAMWCDVREEERKERRGVSFVCFLSFFTFKICPLRLTFLAALRLPVVKMCLIGYQRKCDMYLTCIMYNCLDMICLP